jgi:hypothetical protein
MLVETNYFPDKYSAYLHYRPLYNTNNEAYEAIRIKTNESTIYIGKPKIKRKQKLITKNYKYFISG